MFYCEKCRIKGHYTKGIRGYPTSRGSCELCRKVNDCYDVPSHAMDETPNERKARHHENVKK